MESNPNLFLAFGAGLLSFLSPCVFPLFPSYLSYITGVSVSQLETGGQQVRRLALAHSVAFIGGFSVVFVALGLATSLLGTFFFNYQNQIRVGGGIFVIIMGLALMGVIRIPLLMQERRLNLKNRPAGYLGSAVVGLAFAAGWTPCVGPILASVLFLSFANPGQGLLLLLSYTLGFAVPFLALAYSISFFRPLLRHAALVGRLGGALVVVMGLLLVTDQLTRLISALLRIFNFTGF